MSRTLSAGLSGASPSGVDARSAAPALPALAAALAATSIVVGILWDISWHRSIGRDTFWTPPHMAIYLGGVLAGLTGAALIFRATFNEGRWRAAAVRIGPLRGPLGAWVMVWSAVAMIASAPFDDWWHNAYGLDVRVISPPHAVLAAGMVSAALGAMLLALSIANGARAAGGKAAGALYLYGAGMLVCLVAVFLIEYCFPLHQHSAIFYEVTAGAFPLFLVAAARAARLRYAATAVAAVYMTTLALVDWILPLFPAQARLAPIYYPITRMVPFCFPLLLIFPALAIDWLLARGGRGRDNRLALLLGLGFVAVLLAAQWPFASFQMTPASRNWFFVGDRYWSYWFHPDTSWRYGFDEGVARLSAGRLLLAAGLSVLSARLGLAAGTGMARVRR
jgi:hypothetical protein